MIYFHCILGDYFLERGGQDPPRAVQPMMIIFLKNTSGWWNQRLKGNRGLGNRYGC